VDKPSACHAGLCTISLPNEAAIAKRLLWLGEGVEMSTLQALLSERREQIIELARSHGARNVRVFGSAARGDDRPDSDLDLLVDFEDGRSLLDQAGLWLDLKELLNREVDVVTDGELHPRLASRILAEARPL